MKMRINKRIILSLCFLLIGFSLSAQELFYPLGRDLNTKIDAAINDPALDFHTDIRPYRMAEFAQKIKLDSITSTFYFKPQSKHLWRNSIWRRDNLIYIRQDILTLAIDPHLDLEFNQDAAERGIVNGRGLKLDATIGKKVAITSAFYENQSTFINYIDAYVKSNGIVPGQGYWKKFKTSGYDYGYATGSISYSPSKYFNFNFGNGKNFIGDGYRSVLLSDNAFVYPYLKITTSIGKIKYMNLYTTGLDINHPKDAFNNDDFYRKNMAMHYLSMKFGKHYTLGLFEAVVFRAKDSTSSRGYDWNYLNPVIFLRPVEFSLGSSDNALMGLNQKLSISKSFLLYNQIMLDEFKLSEVRAGKGWHGNKQAFQLGLKYFNVATLKNLNLQMEFNYVRPYMYSHYNTLENYGHYNQPLAHPMGANFWEAISFLNYRYKSFFFEGRGSFAMKGYDIYDKTTKTYLNYGSNIYRSYYDRPDLDGTNNYGYFMATGLTTKIIYADFRVQYVINPKTNLNFEAGVTERITSDNINGMAQHTILHFGLRTSLTNAYFDF